MQCKCRRGFTLIEMLAFISITSVMLFLATAWIHETLEFSNRIQTNRDQHNQLTRLGWSLREDVRKSEAMSIEDDTRLVLMQRNGTQVVYTIAGTSVEVKKTLGDKARFEKFRTARNSLVYWDTSEMPKTIGLIVARGPEPKLSLQTTSDESDLSQRPASENTNTESTPIDVHIFASVARWPVEYTLETPDGGTDR